MKIVSKKLGLNWIACHVVVPMVAGLLVAVGGCAGDWDGGGTGAGGRSRPAKPAASLTDTHWRLTELDGQPVPLGAGQRELHLVMGTRGRKVQGFSGCNSFGGSYELGGERLSFGNLAGTMMACAEGMEQEQRFLAALARTTRFTLNGDTLALYSGGGRPILRFRSVHRK